VTYRLDPDFSFVHFEVLHFGTSTIHGRFGPVQGSVVLDREAGRGEVGLRIATAGVSTGWAVFDARLREPDLLASAAWPEAYFVATKFRFDGGALAEVRGEFTWRGTSQPLSLRALRFACHTENDHAGTGVERCGGDFEGEFLRSDFGSTFGLPFVGNRVRLRVQVEGERQ
jgi:polyisoprenoid-binding protein YceI